MIKGTSTGLFFISVIALTAFISTVFAQSEVDLSISVESTLDVVPVNNNFDTTVTVENLSSATATFVTITDNLLSGITFITSPDACMVSASDVNCSIGELPAGEVVTVTYTVRASITGDGIQNNVLSVQLRRIRRTSNQIFVDVRIYNPQADAVTLALTDIGMIFGFTPFPAGSTARPVDFEPIVFEPELSLDVTLTWDWNSDDPFARLELAGSVWLITLIED